MNTKILDKRQERTMKIGLDFGCSNTKLSYLVENKNGTWSVQNYKNSNGTSSFESLVTKSTEGNYYMYGDAAKSAITDKDDVTAYTGFKMMLASNVEKQLEERGYNKDITPKFITSIYLKNFLNNFMRDNKIDETDKFEKIVVGFPESWRSNYNDNLSHSELMDIIYDLNVAEKDNIILISEPILAAAAYVHSHQSTSEPYGGYLLVADFGGGTIDFSICKIDGIDSQHSNIDVIYKSGCDKSNNDGIGCSALGFFEDIVNTALNNNNIKPVKNPSYHKFLNALEDAIKRRFDEEAFFETYSGNRSCANEVFLKHSFLYETADGKTCCDIIDVTYAMIYEAYNRRIRGPLENELAKAKVRLSELGINYGVHSKNFRILTCGGFSAFYLVREQIQKSFAIVDFLNDPRYIKSLGKNPSDIISQGAALIANDKVGFKRKFPYEISLVFYKDSDDSPTGVLIDIDQEYTPDKPVPANGFFAINEIKYLKITFLNNECRYYAIQNPIKVNCLGCKICTTIDKNENISLDAYDSYGKHIVKSQAIGRLSEIISRNII